MYLRESMLEMFDLLVDVLGLALVVVLCVFIECRWRLVVLSWVITVTRRLVPCLNIAAFFHEVLHVVGGEFAFPGRRQKVIAWEVPLRVVGVRVVVVDLHGVGRDVSEPRRQRVHVVGR